MTTQDHLHYDSGAPRSSQGHWSAQIAAAALAVQALLYLGATVFAVMQVNWETPIAELVILDPAIRAVSTILALGPVIIALFATALIVLVRPAAGWTVAQFIQTVLLLIGVQLYFADVNATLLLPPAWRDLLVLGSILVVIYLYCSRSQAEVFQ
jgi:hypothetical protein